MKMNFNKNFVATLSSGVMAVAVFSMILPPAGKSQSVVKVDPLLQQTLATVGNETLRAIITYNQKPTASQVQILQNLGLTVKTFSVLPMVGVVGTKSQITQISSLPEVVSVWQDKPLNYLLRESVPLIGADKVQSTLSCTGKGVGVAVIDSGIDGLHQDLKKRMVQNVKIIPLLGIDVPLNPSNTDTTSGHGTHVAGTIAGDGTASRGEYKGVSPEANLIGLGAGELLFILSALEGFDYAIANRETYNIKVISNSWGTTGTFDPTDPINVASKTAYDAGITVVFAAGNEGPANNTLNPYSVAPWVIGVAAGNKDGTTLANFSSRGIPGDNFYSPTITAPGAGIVAPRAITGAITLVSAPDDVNINPLYAPYYTTLSGTSMATPHVSGVVALLKQANPALTPDQIKQILTQTATPMGDYQRFQVGAGYLNALEAVKDALPEGNKSSCSDTALLQSTLSANQTKALFGNSFKHKIPDFPKLNYASSQRYVPKSIALNQSVSIQS